MITIHTMAYNEEKLLPHFVRHYRRHFPQAMFVVYDNESTDGTRKICDELGLQVSTHATHGLVSDSALTALKNNCWKSAPTDWVLVCDIDEWLGISSAELAAEAALGTTIIRSEAWDMVAMHDADPVDEITRGVRSPIYDKWVLFDHSKISESNYDPGAHNMGPVGTVRVSDTCYKLFHMRHLGVRHTLARIQYTHARLSPENRAQGWGTQYFDVPEEASVVANYATLRQQAVEVRPHSNARATG